MAAIGIANTMMMSIYERTKEIGVMKVLGCDMGNIRNMFLIESGFIGFMGGIVGILLSYGISVVINRFVNLEEMNGLTGNLSRIPPWLSVAAVVFAIFVGMAAGFMQWENAFFPWTLNYDEIDMVLEGELHVRHQGETLVAKAGDVMFIPKGSSIEFGTPSTVRFLYVAWPANWQSL